MRHDAGSDEQHKMDDYDQCEENVGGNLHSTELVYEWLTMLGPEVDSSSARNASIVEFEVNGLPEPEPGRPY